MRFLVDNALGVSLAEQLRALGHDAVHVQELGISHADDPVIFDRAEAEGRVLIATDADFSALLALRKAATPSLIVFRTLDKRPASLVRVLAANLATITSDLAAGSVVVIEDRRMRVRKLPLLP